MLLGYATMFLAVRLWLILITTCWLILFNFALDICCARVPSGRAATPPTSAMNSRRLIRPPSPMTEHLTLLRLAASCTLHGTTLCLLGLVMFQSFHSMPDVFPKQPGDVTWTEFLTAVAGGLWLANLAILWRTTAR